MRSVRKIAAAGIVAALAAVSFAPAATAAPPPEFEDFLPCPWENVEITDCVHWVFNDGSYTIGSKTVPVVNTITLHGGYTGEALEDQFHAPQNGDTLSKTPQPVPGGLLGVTAPTAWPMFLQEWWNEMIGTGFTGVNATIELAEPATAIELSYENLLEEEGTTLGLPVKIKLDNAILGANCYIGSNEEPVELALSTGKSGSLTGTPGTLSFNPKFTIFTFTGIEVVDGTYALPGADGCGGIFSEFVDPLVDSIFGLPSASEENAATFEGVLRDASATAMRD
ncbi:MAG: hypothetical protein WBL45_09575 [Solirubrobacterales bacterium]